MESSSEPKYLYTQEEVDRKVKETMIKDSKLDACLDKFHCFYLKAADYKEPLYSCIRYDGSDIKDGPGKCVVLKEMLMDDIGTLLPEYWRENNLSSAPLDEKFNHLKPRIRDRWNCVWRKVQKPAARDDFMDAILHTLTEKRVHELTTGAEKPAPGGTRSLLSSSCLAGLKELQWSIEGEQTNAVFACGGSIAIVSPPAEDIVETALEDQAHGERVNVEDVQESKKNDGEDANSGDEGEDENEIVDEDGDEAEEQGVDLLDEDALLRRESAPIRVTWSSSDGSNHKMVFPTEDVSALEKLVNDCAPATFGFRDKDVLDTSYRHAGKLEPSNFLTSFHPADFGILDMVEQTLLPSINSAQDNDLQYRRVRVELYKLNIYSGPSGLFRAHVDTPRSDSQFGSLVVCLPSKFRGGNLAVRHNGRVIDYDWSPLSVSHIQWAAFYSDCEHEISKVSDGHRVTLTYNLYITEPVGAALISRPLVDPSSYPLYGQIKSILDQPGFLPRGGVLGFFCSHSYAHTSSTAKRSLPRKLKGSDLALFAVLKSLGLRAKVLPVLQKEGKYFIGNENGLETSNSAQRSDGTRASRAATQYHDDDADRDVEQYRKMGYMEKDVYEGGWKTVRRTFELPYTYTAYDLEGYNDINERWKRILMTRHPTGSSKESVGAMIGTALHPYILSDWGSHKVSNEIAKMKWPHENLPGITWVTSPKEERLALTHLCYGNQASLASRYSCAAVIAHVPPFGQRNAPENQ